MRRLRYTLLGDGSSDRALMPVLRWLLRQHCQAMPFDAEFADLRNLPQPPRLLSERIAKCVELYPCDLLFVHRDAERSSLDDRVSEIREALARSDLENPPPTIEVVPVRMQETWLLLHESALRQACGNPRGDKTLNLPRLRDLESLHDPKQTLFSLMRDASGLRGRHLDRFNRNPGRRLPQLADRIRDFGPLRQLPAFRRLEETVERVVTANGWAESP